MASSPVTVPNTTPWRIIPRGALPGQIFDVAAHTIAAMTARPP
jgi:hypothetical protein